MDKFEALWAYQEEDMKADAIAAAIRRSPIRQKLEKARDFILERQKQYKQIEEDIAAMVDRKDIIAQAIARSREQLQSLQTRFETNPPKTPEEVRSLLAEVSRCRDTIRQYEAEIARIARESSAHEKQQRVTLDMPQESQSETFSFGSALDDTGDVGHHKRLVITIAHNT